VQVQSAGLSLLSPTLTVYAADQVTVLGSASGAGQYGTTISVTLTGVSAGQVFYIKVAGAETTTLGSGKYALSLNFGTGALPRVGLPNTQTVNGNPISSGGGVAQEPGHEGDHAHRGPAGGVADAYPDEEKSDALGAGLQTSPAAPRGQESPLPAP